MLSKQETKTKHAECREEHVLAELTMKVSSYRDMKLCFLPAACCILLRLFFGPEDWVPKRCVLNKK
jgi:hypothetical protein